FNPSTTIEFSVPELSEVNISVYSIIGEKVATVVNKTFEAGYHNVNFNAVDLPSGTYIYTVNAVGENDTFSESKKMMLLK
ncbi:MAG: T9SS type A sorting domain-containing protein, partial [Ignavibacteria bacterium]|nr:T9SS type A sorting domain-containing protein [Ignavibacteria bacterium]NNL21581.1 T9SS type A sorting domain-containing protein [Ignavibacteriaceae bacterium]